MSKVWFITGSSRGLGRELVRAALDNGDAATQLAEERAGLEPRATDYESLRSASATNQTVNQYASNCLRDNRFDPCRYARGTPAARPRSPRSPG